MSSESRPTKYTVLTHVPGPSNRTKTHTVTYTVPAEVTRQGTAAQLYWLAHKLKEKACNSKTE